MKKIRLFYGLLSLLTLIAGMVIYLLFRDINKMIIFTWMPKPEFLKSNLIPLAPSIFSYILKFNLPDMLWFVSAILFFRFIWFYRKKEQTVYILCWYGIGLIFEISQLSEKIPGTFDRLDLTFLCIGALIESLININFASFTNKRHNVA